MGRLGPAVLVLGCLLAGRAAAGDETDWSLHLRSCDSQVTSALRVPCGSYGVLHFASISYGGCPPMAAGRETPSLYPHPAMRVQGASNPPTSAPAAGGDAARPSKLGERSSPPAPWTAVIDWNDAHGQSVRDLVDLLAAGSATATLYALDGPDLAALGEEVGDAHVLARLCAVAEEAELLRGVPPLSLNLSFGRLPGAGEEANAATCDAGRLSCQIAAVLDHLRGLGTVPVAAAGNHQQLLFPAVLEEALAAASLDVTRFLLTGLPAALWQAPQEAEVLLPGHALCVNGEVLPAGSSYASALFAGWYAFLAATNPAVPGAFAAPWSLVWSAAQDCWVLGQAGAPQGDCNPGLGPAVAGIVSGLASGCWQAAGAGGKPLVVVYGPGTPEPQPALPSLDVWLSWQQHPAPESDPCIPCVEGSYSKALGSALEWSTTEVGPEDVFLNLSASVSVDPAVHLDRVYFRVEEDFYPLDLTPGDLDALEQGDVGGLVLAGYGSLLPTSTQPSLFYLFTDDPAADCTDPAPGQTACFWSSTPILLP